MTVMTGGGGSEPKNPEIINDVIIGWSLNQLTLFPLSLSLVEVQLANQNVSVELPPFDHKFQKEGELMMSTKN